MENSDENDLDIGPVDSFEGTLNDEKLESVSNILFEKLGTRKCEMCDNELWAISNAYVSPVVLRSDEKGNPYKIASSITAPMLMISCTKCGNSKFFRTDILGIVPAQVEEHND